MGTSKPTSLDIMTTDPKKRPVIWTFEEYTKLEDAVRRFFEILDIKEYSGMSDREFHPNKMDFENGKVSSVRVYNAAELEHVFREMKRLSNYNEAHLPTNT